MARYRAALVGTGGITQSHLKAMQQLQDRLELVAAFNPYPDLVRTFGQQTGLTHLYTDLGQMLRDESPDLVVNCAPPFAHADESIQCLEAGAWVLCEKPLCASLAQFDRIADAEQRTGRWLSTVFQWRFGSAGQHYRHMIESGALGEPRVVVCNTLWYRDAAYFEVPWRGKWDTEVGGVSTGHAIHITDLMLWLLGGWPWAELQAQVATLDRAIENENLAMGLVRFSNGALGSISSSTLSPRQNTYLRMDFQRGTLEVEALYGYRNENWRFTPLDPSEDFSAWQPVPDDQPADHAAQYAQLLDSMDAGTRPPVSGDEGLRILEFTSSLYKSAFTGQSVARGSIVPGDPYYRSLSGKAPAD